MSPTIHLVAFLDRSVRLGRVVRFPAMARCANAAFLRRMSACVGWSLVLSRDISRACCSSPRVGEHGRPGQARVACKTWVTGDSPARWQQTKAQGPETVEVALRHCSAERPTHHCCVVVSCEDGVVTSTEGSGVAHSVEVYIDLRNDCRDMTRAERAGFSCTE